MSRHNFIISISEDEVDPSHGESVFDMAWHHSNYPNHSEVIKVLDLAFPDWRITVVPLGGHS